MDTGYVRQLQIASAIAHDCGRDKFVWKDGTMHCTLPLCCLTVCNDEGDAGGVEVLQMYGVENDESNSQRPCYDHPFDLLTDKNVRENLVCMSRTDMSYHKQQSSRSTNYQSINQNVGLCGRSQLGDSLVKTQTKIYPQRIVPNKQH